MVKIKKKLVTLGTDENGTSKFADLNEDDIVTIVGNAGSGKTTTVVNMFNELSNMEDIEFNFNIFSQMKSDLTKLNTNSRHSHYITHNVNTVLKKLSDIANELSSRDSVKSLSNEEDSQKIKNSWEHIVIVFDEFFHYNLDETHVNEINKLLEIIIKNSDDLGVTIIATGQTTDSKVFPKVLIDEGKLKIQLYFNKLDALNEYFGTDKNSEYELLNLDERYVYFKSTDSLKKFRFSPKGF